MTCRDCGAQCHGHRCRDCERMNRLDEYGMTQEDWDDVGLTAFDEESDRDGE